MAAPHFFGNFPIIFNYINLDIVAMGSAPPVLEEQAGYARADSLPGELYLRAGGIRTRPKLDRDIS